MDIYQGLLSKFRLSVNDKYMCNYLLTDKFISSKSHLESIFQTLLEKYNAPEAYELIICGLYSIDVHIHVSKDHCPKKLYEKHKNKLNKDKFLHIQINRHCTDVILIEFMKIIFKKKFSSINAKLFFEHLSNEAIPDDRSKQIREFYDYYIISDVETDGKRKKVESLNLEVLPEQRLHRERYEIYENRHNFCLIFNNPKRSGSQVDVDLISETFSNIRGFSVQTVDITTVDLLKKNISDYCSQVDDNCDMIVSFFMTHGNEHSVMDGESKELSYLSIISLFDIINAPKLNGKPKIIVFQTCRGEEMEQVIEFDSPKTPHLQPRVDNKLRQKAKLGILHSDFFIIYATVPNTRAMRDPISGSYFIQKFCKIIQENSKKLSVDQMCTRVNQEKVIFKDNEGRLITQLCEVQKVLLKDDIYLEN